MWNASDVVAAVNVACFSLEMQTAVQVQLLLNCAVL
jgi:hypothetical protein